MRCPRLPLFVIPLALLSGACSQLPPKETAENLPEVVTAEAEPPEQRVEYIVPEPELLPEEAAEEVVPVEGELPGPVAQYGDLWERIGANLNLPRHLEHKSVKGRLAWYARNQAYLDRVVERSRPYLYHVVTEVEKRGMPLELALLPIVESAFHPFAYSRSHASGIWQFIPSTGKIFRMKQNWWYDGRRDIVEATRGALDYLEKLSGDFDGDWLLALAAYNTGERNVERAVRRNKKAGKATDFFSLRLPRETRGYVPSLLAVAELVANPEQYGIAWKPVTDQQYFAQVDAGGQIDLAIAAELAGMSMDEFYTLNPGFNRWATDPDGPHRLLVPVAREESFQKRLAALAPEQRISWTSHQVNKGETLGGIAARYRTSVAALKSVNELRGNTIHQGDMLRVAAPREALKHYTLSVDGRRLRGLKHSGDGNKYVYTVKRGDTLWDIGKHYGVSVKQLTGWNGISSRKYLRPGQKLTLWFAEDNKQAPTAGGQPASDPFHYTVKKGDSLWSIAKKFNVTIKQLLVWNNLRRNKHLHPNQKITVYQNGSS
ncbi:MAG: LysM peptidoglycan-binding domain-containing protein, partial [Gammaproteobacteria bacterium]|nr:LysM peptidoglycan-binding domain-containing protein [Gammaproteobacteria bacterium]MCY4337404.1 LysM peptidoglycan-binding domain-containing protein [Gammaproteobacteria bacterium]